MIKKIIFILILVSLFYFRPSSVYSQTIQGDLNNDGKVDIFDFSNLISNFGKTGSPGFIPADINRDGNVDIFDFSILLGNFGKTASVPSPTPLTTKTPTPYPTTPISGNVKVLCDGKTYDGWGTTSPFEFGGNPDDNNPNIQKVIRNCNFVNTRDIGIPKAAIFIKTVNNLLIENSLFDNIRTHQAGNDVGAIKFGNSGASEYIKNVTIRNNKFDGIGSDGIQIGDLSPRSSNITVTGNEFIGYDGTGENSLDIKSTDGPIVIGSNYIHGFRPCNSPKHGGTQDCSGSVGEGLVIHLGGHLAPELTIPPNNITVENNRIENNTYGIAVSEGTNITLRGNQYANNIKANCVIKINIACN